MTDKVPLRVKIGLRPNGHADHPDWFSLPSVPNDTENVERFLDIEWIYDKISGHNDDTVGSPIGSQLGVVFLSPAIAREALNTLPAKLNATALNETQLTDFWNNNFAPRFADNLIDNPVLTALKTELDLRLDAAQDVTALRAKIVRALDPDDNEPGLKRNRIKVFADYKFDRNIRVVAPPA